VASRRFRARKTLAKSVDRIDKRMRYVEKRTAKTRLTPRVVTTEKLYAKTVTTEKIADNAVTTQIIAPGAVTTDEIDFNAGDIGGSTSYVQPSAPSNPNLGDLWFDDGNDNELKQWNGSAWVSVRDATIAIAQSAATAAQTTADGKNQIYRQGTTPSGSFTVGDLWFDTANDNRIARWDGGSWVAYGLGNAAIANLDAGKITAGYIAADRIAANSLNANKIVSGTISGTQIAGDAIDGKTITGATVRTANSSTRTEMNSSGLFVYSGGSEVVALRSNGTASFSGSVSASSFSAPGLVEGGSGGDLASSTITDYNISSLNADKVTAGTFTGVNYQSDSVVAGGDFSGNRSMLITAENATPGLYMYDDVNDKVELTAFYGLLMQYGDTKISTNINLLSTGNRVQIDTTNSTYAVEVGGSVNVTSQLRSGGNLVVGGNASIDGNLLVTGTLNATVSSASTANNSSYLGGVAASGYLRSNTADTHSGGTLTVNVLQVQSTMGISGGFGITSGWSPQTTNAYTLGASGRVWTAVWATDTTINSSDRRTKDNIADSPLGLDFVNALRPRVFTRKISHNEEILDENGNNVLDENGDKTFRPVIGTRPHYGFITQEVRETYPQFVEDFGGFVLADKNDPESDQFLRYTEFIAPMAKAIQELSAQVSSLQARIVTLEG
jgi:hypothetical protein